MLEELIPLLVAAVTGAVVMPLFQLFKKASTWLDAQNAWIKRLLVGVLSFAAVKLTTLTGITIPSDIFSIDATTLQTLVSFGAATLLHFLKNKIFPAKEA